MAKQEKKLFISTRDPIPDVVAMYLKKVGLTEWESGFPFGFIVGASISNPILGKSFDVHKHLVTLLELHFYAGINYAFKHKDKIEFAMLNEEDFRIKIDKLKDKHKVKKDEIIGKVPSYMG